jgi:hypothetical protein
MPTLLATLVSAFLGHLLDQTLAPALGSVGATGVGFVGATAAFFGVRSFFTGLRDGS